MNLNLYIEKNVLIDNYHESKNLLNALSALCNVSKNIKIKVLDSERTSNFSFLDDYFNYEVLNHNYKELMQKIDKITKDEILLSYNQEDLYAWDFERGKAILIKQNNYRQYEDMCFNKVIVSDSTEDILKKLRMYIHI